MTNLYKIFRECGAVSTDTRKIEPGSVFFALKGANFDGNRYAAEAIAKGASWAVVDDPFIMTSERYILVDDALQALQELAGEHRRHLEIPVVAITGTNGKTTTKELAARVLSAQYKVAVTEGNLNNHIGVPLTLLKIKPHHQIAIIEMGAGARGEIELLCRTARPDHGLITNIGRAHLEGFGGAEGVRAGKGELYDWLEESGGTAFYNTGDDTLSAMIAERPAMKKVGYSTALADGIESNLVGGYNRYNIAAAMALGRYFSVEPSRIAEAIRTYSPDNMRSESRRGKFNDLILDCYNANPSSMRAAIENFAAIETPSTKAVILGDMLELGEFTPGEHSRITELLADAGIENVFLVGASFFMAARNGQKAFGNKTDLTEYLAQNPLRGNLVLIKGSRGIGLDTIAEEL